jgi:DME family drug/metabolite transporter
VIGVLFALLSGITFGALNIAMRRGIDRRHDVAAASVVMSSVALTLTAATTFALHGFALDLRELWPFLLIGLAVPGASQLATVHAIRGAGASRAGILLGMGPLFSAVFAIAAFGEAIHAGLVVGTLLIVAGGVTLAWERERPLDFRLYGVVVALGVAVFFGVRDNVARAVADGVDAPALAQSTVTIGAAALFLALNLVRQRDADARLRRVFVGPYVLAGAFTAAAQVTLFEALDRTRVTVVAPLAGTAVLWTVLFAAFFLGRSELIGRRLVAVALLVVAGSALVGATR